MLYYSDDGCAYLVPARPIRAAGPHGTLRPLARRGLQGSPVGLPWPPAPATRVRPGRGRTPRDPSGLPLMSSEKRGVLAAWPGLAWRPSRAPVSSSSDPAVNGGRAWAEGSPVCPAPALRPFGSAGRLADAGSLGLARGHGPVPRRPTGRRTPRFRLVPRGPPPFTLEECPGVGPCSPSPIFGPMARDIE